MHESYASPDQMGAKSVLTLGLQTDGALDGNHSELQLESIGRIGEGDIELVVERPGMNSNVGLVVARSDLVRLDAADQAEVANRRERRQAVLLHHLQLAACTHIVQSRGRQMLLTWWKGTS